MAKSDAKIKPIKGFPDYFVSIDGKVFSIKSNKMKQLKPDTSNYNHCRVSLCKSGKITYKQIHRLVLEAFVGKCPKGMQACHINGNPLCNHVYNLRWDTPKSNHADAIKHGTHTCLHQEGELAGNHKLTINEVIEIKRLLKYGFTQRKLGKLYNVDKSTIGYINTGKTWKRVYY